MAPRGYQNVGDVMSLREKLHATEKERDHWKANHDNVVMNNASREGWKKALYEECTVLDQARLKSDAERDHLRSVLRETLEALDAHKEPPCTKCGGEGRIQHDVWTNSFATPVVRLKHGVTCPACRGLKGPLSTLIERIRKELDG